MSRLKTFAAALATSACFISPVLAADIYDEGSMKDDVVITTPPITWTGFFIGAGAGGAFIDRSGTVEAYTDIEGSEYFLPLDLSETRGFGTVQIGYDRQIDRFVVGVFADYEWFKSSKTSSFEALSGPDDDELFGSVTAELKDSWTIGGRIGGLASPSTLIYGLAGWTHGSLRLNGDFDGLDDDVPFDFSAAGSRSVDALTVGGGVETMLRENVSLKFEYRYTDFGALGIFGVEDLGEGDFVEASVDTDTDVHSVRAVLSWRPGM